MTFAGVFSIIVGVGMIGQWTFSYIARQIPELESEPIRIWFHIAAEMVTAVCLIAGGIGGRISVLGRASFSEQEQFWRYTDLSFTQGVRGSVSGNCCRKSGAPELQRRISLVVKDVAHFTRGVKCAMFGMLIVFGAVSILVVV